MQHKNNKKTLQWEKKLQEQSQDSKGHLKNANAPEWPNISKQ